MRKATHLAVLIMAAVLPIACSSGGARSSRPTVTALPCAREAALVQFDERLVAQFGPAPVNGSIPLRTTEAARLLTKAQAALIACVTALHK